MGKFVFWAILLGFFGSCASTLKNVPNRSVAAVSGVGLGSISDFIIPESGTCVLAVSDLIQADIDLGANFIKKVKNHFELDDAFMESVKREHEFKEITELHDTTEERDKALLVLASLKKRNPEMSSVEIKKLYHELLNPCD